MRRATADSPLHYGSAPRWLFRRMVPLAREVCRIVVENYGPHELLARLSDPVWFQAFGCLAGFDWHSSGLTTTLCGAVKEALRGTEADLGVRVCGGKGAASRRTPDEIVAHCDALGSDPAPLVRASRLTAKVDSAALQDGFRIYHHTFLFADDGTWCVIQQGMNTATRYARRYHWLSRNVSSFVSDPHTAIACDLRRLDVLNTVAGEARDCRAACVDLAGRPKEVLDLLRKMEAGRIRLPERHHITAADVDPRRMERTLAAAAEALPADFEQLLLTRNVGPKTVRALALAAEVIHAAPPSFTDPARFAFAHGGKDGHPYPVDRRTYDRTIEFLKEVVSKSAVPPSEKNAALRRLR